MMLMNPYSMYESFYLLFLKLMLCKIPMIKIIQTVNTKRPETNKQKACNKDKFKESLVFCFSDGGEISMTLFLRTGTDVAMVRQGSQRRYPASCQTLLIASNGTKSDSNQLA